jgi:hypothetical protein
MPDTSFSMDSSYILLFEAVYSDIPSLKRLSSEDYGGSKAVSVDGHFFCVSPLCILLGSILFYFICFTLQKTGFSGLRNE